ncbi:ATP-dependent DNA helicase RecG [Blastochloris viridis]|uniref:ATP-dependent DNA helicase RecG n=1 Tax=Blastochloris viridis TaxID=1079 RepID=A0A0H5BJY0_BLAVI|nr:ATP-dependent DNA helicase RecG [Blastochloris viridis]ALK09290.1 ATP-dependent DNA helicase RecG [Blastochloris viridis]BAS00837.1 ATP-dependent DNA helicase RecG [Blastochloris viridis]CUU41953.1 ATP-dependent DNA helicase recG [Blastochloris viridis]
MRPSVLDPLFAPITALPGIGPRLRPLYDRLLGRDGSPARVVDLVLHLPHTVIDRRWRPKLAEVRPGVLATVEVTVDQHRPPPPGRAKAPWRVHTHDDTGDLSLVYFKGDKTRLERLYPVGERRIVSGTVEMYDGMLQMAHPDRVVSVEDAASLPALEPVYPLTEGLALGHLRRAAAAALARLPALPEWQDAAHLARNRWPPFTDALRTLHAPAAPEDLDPESPAWRRLAYDELFAGQLALQLLRSHMRREPGRRSLGDGRVRDRLIKALPFVLTASQQQAVADISADLAADTRMIRLLQGDVGAGKTVVALIAMAQVVESGRQAALMAPTEILARQHFSTIARFAEAAGLRSALLTGREKGRTREAIVSALAAGELDIVVGTHALFQDDVAFKDLAFAVVDEQHRFGVHQRLALASKGEAVDLLVMTATPIPRTLVLTYFGDMDISSLTEKPAGRLPIDTRTVPLERLPEVVDAVGRAVASGARVYWVCPLVEESSEVDLAAAEDRAALLRTRFGTRVGLIHGRLKGSEKDAAMASFAAGDTAILVATTVIEVGVDVPEATVMVVEHAERFGLAQLHQLRGRIGRGDKPSTCLLLYKGPLGETAKARLAILRDSEDGFRIAEEDLRLRGEGDVLGTRQSGFPGFRLARLESHGALLPAARDEAAAALAGDPALASERGRALRVLLHLFERTEAVRLLQAG